ncbi:hypothetical protein PGTUg99_026676 [Puccinia graminis f. sp. tritici]|uniref:RNase P subunit p30 n=1 Tax=Puccinia graminis f. sp. tritici TaxID=56615 RepID=A0A5B0R8D2_PUCGR|nr:hypothetical protein PGTUg99_026676 [Puccinia graminis f. sp. tritici]
MPLSTVSNALKQGVLFEAIYSPTTSLNSFRSHSSSGLPVSASSSTCRRNLISVLKEIIRVTNCAHGLVVSSGATRWAELRAPGDVINLLNVLGISHENGRKAMTTNPKMLVSRAMSTRQTHKAVISNPVIVSSSSPAGASKRPLPPCDSLDPPVLVQGFKYTDTSNDKDLKRLKT